MVLHIMIFNNVAIVQMTLFVIIFTLLGQTGVNISQ